jgi:hypothetical protein
MMLSFNKPIQLHKTQDAQLPNSHHKQMNSTKGRNLGILSPLKIKILTAKNEELLAHLTEEEQKYATFLPLRVANHLKIKNKRRSSSMLMKFKFKSNNTQDNLKVASSLCLEKGENKIKLQP